MLDIADLIIPAPELYQLLEQNTFLDVVVASGSTITNGVVIDPMVVKYITPSDKHGKTCVKITLTNELISEMMQFNYRFKQLAVELELACDLCIDISALFIKSCTITSISFSDMFSSQTIAPLLLHMAHTLTISMATGSDESYAEVIDGIERCGLSTVTHLTVHLLPFKWISYNKLVKLLYTHFRHVDTVVLVLSKENYAQDLSTPKMLLLQQFLTNNKHISLIDTNSDAVLLRKFEKV